VAAQGGRAAWLATVKGAEGNQKGDGNFDPAVPRRARRRIAKSNKQRETERAQVEEKAEEGRVLQQEMARAATGNAGMQRLTRQLEGQGSSAAEEEAPIRRRSAT